MQINSVPKVYRAFQIAARLPNQENPVWKLFFLLYSVGKNCTLLKFYLIM